VPAGGRQGAGCESIGVGWGAASLRWPRASKPLPLAPPKARVERGHPLNGAFGRGIAHQTRPVAFLSLLLVLPPPRPEPSQGWKNKVCARMVRNDATAGVAAPRVAGRAPRAPPACRTWHRAAAFQPTGAATSLPPFPPPPPPLPIPPAPLCASAPHAPRQVLETLGYRPARHAEAITAPVFLRAGTRDHLTRCGTRPQGGGTQWAGDPLFWLALGMDRSLGAAPGRQAGSR
jgi:hypothetical protein